MNAFSMRTAWSIFALVLMCLSVKAPMAQTATSRIVSAANTFLATLDQKQKQTVLFAFDDEKQRALWSNLPDAMVHRAGLKMGDLNAAQRSAAFAFVSAALSKKGFQKVQEIMEGDEMLKTNERNNSMFGKDLFFISILGT